MRQLNPKLLYFICALTIIIVLSHEFLQLNSRIIHSCLKIITTAICAFWLYFLVKESKFYKTIFGRLVFISIIVIIIAFFLQFSWNQAGIIVMIGFAGIFITYAWRFLVKKKKRLVDILKLLLVESTVLIALLVLLHRLPSESFKISELLFVLLICAFTIDYNKRTNILI